MKYSSKRIFLFVILFSGTNAIYAQVTDSIKSRDSRIALGVEVSVAQSEHDYTPNSASTYQIGVVAHYRIRNNIYFKSGIKHFERVIQYTDTDTDADHYKCIGIPAAVYIVH